MNSTFNPYASWLGLPVSTRSPSHYDLLGLSPTETSLEEIAKAADVATSKVRAIRPGEHAAAWAQLLDELAMAKSVLLDPASRTAYDDQRESQQRAVERETPDSPTPNETTASTPAAPTAPNAPTRNASIEMAVEIATPSAQETEAKYPPGFTPPIAPEIVTAPSQDPASQRSPAPAQANPPATNTPAVNTPVANPPATSIAASSPASETQLQQPTGPMSPMAQDGMATPIGRPVGPLPNAPMAPAYPASPAAPQTATPMGQPAAAPLMSPAADIANPMAPVTTTPPAMPVAQAVVHPVGGGGSSSIPVGHAAADPNASASQDVTGANTSTSKEASRRRKLAWAAPLSVLAGVAVLSILIGAVYFGMKGRNNGQVAENSPNEDANGTETNGSGAAPVAGDDTSGGATPNETGTGGTGTAGTGTAGTGTAGTGTAGTGAGETSSGKSGASDLGNSPYSPPSQTPSANDTESTTKTIVPVIPVEGTPADSTNTTVPIVPAEGTPADSTKTTVPVAPVEGEPTEPTKTNKPPTSTGDQANATETGPTKQEIVEFRDAMLNAYDATCLHDFKAASEKIEVAKTKAKTEEHKQMAARLEEVADYVKQYRAAIEKAVSGLSSGTVFQVGEFTVALVERGKDFIKIRAAGQTRHYKLNALPRGTGLALGDMVLDQLAPSTKVLQGAYLLAHPRVDEEQLQQADAVWRRAIEDGAKIEHLLPALKDDYAAIK